MSVVVKIISYAFFIIQGYFFYKTIACFLEPRRKIVYRILGGMIGVVVCSMVIFPQDMVNVTWNLPLFLLMLVVGFRQRLLVKVSIGLLFFPIVIAVNFLLMDVGSWLFFKYTNGSYALSEIIATASLIFTVLFWFGFMKVARKSPPQTSDTLDDKSWLLLDAIGLASLAMVISGVYFTPAETYKIWLCMIACIIADTGSIRLVFYLAESIRGEMERKNLKLQKTYYQELEHNQLELRRFRHDLNNHFSVTAELLEAGKMEEAKEYFEKLTCQMRAKGRTFCKNSIVNAVFNAKYNRAVEQGIDCFFHIEIDGLLFIEDMDICTIFANVLDNAIEACMGVNPPQKRSISVKARCTSKGYFSCEIRNAKVNEVQLKKGMYLTGKRDSKAHGIGLENVKEVVARYQGTLDITYEEKEFCVVILIAS